MVLISTFGETKRNLVQQHNDSTRATCRRKRY